MTERELDRFLRDTLPLEKTYPEYRGEGETYYYDPATKAKQIPNEFRGNTADFVADASSTPQYIKITRNFRFREVAEHNHSFIELNYLYSGKCTNIVDGIKYDMSVGDILIMDTNSRHSLGRTDENDILINMLILPEYAESAFMEMLTGDSVLSAFLVNAINHVSDQPNHIYFKAEENPVLYTALTNLLREYYDPSGAGANILINCYVREIFTLMMRECVEHPENVLTAYDPNSTVAQIINFIKDNCVTCTRESTARHFGYSTNHLSQMLTRRTGKGFVQLRNEFRLNNVEQMIKSTKLPVKVLAEEYGFSNTTHFYKLYKEYFGKYPRDTV
jgi:AraC-like DNA-binding protein